MKIHYINGDATKPIGEGNKIICHICNDIGKWGKGFVMSVSRRWRLPRIKYINQYEKNGLKLGQVQFIRVEPDIVIANMIAQHRLYNTPIRYNALEKCLTKVSNMATATDSSLHMPKIGCGLAGGRWEKIEKIIKKTCKDNVYVYTLQLSIF